MMNLAEIDGYLAQLPYTQAFTDLSDGERQLVAFGAWEMLRRRYGTAVITNEMTALQAVYIAEGESEEFAKFKRQKVTNVSLDGMSFALQANSGDNIAPEVTAIVEAIQKAESETLTVFFGELR